MSDETMSQAEWIRSALERHEGALIRYAMGVTGNLEQARDVVQDTFLKLCTADRQKVGNHLAQWLYTVCRNRALDIGRKEQRMTALSDGQLQAAGEPRRRPPDETGGQVLALLGALPPRQQEAVRLKFQGGLSYREISTVMDTTANNVGVLIHTALKTIREKLGEVNHKLAQNALLRNREYSFVLHSRDELVAFYNEVTRIPSGGKP